MRSKDFHFKEISHSICLPIHLFSRYEKYVSRIFSDMPENGSLKPKYFNNYFFLNHLT